MKKFLYLLIILVIVIAVYFGIEIKLNNEKNNEVETQVIDENLVEEEKVEESNEKESRYIAYEKLINDYDEALEEYDLEDIKADEKLEQNHELVDASLIVLLKRYDGNKLDYLFYDIDDNGTDELIFGISDKDSTIFTPTSLYSYNAETLEVEKLYFTSTIERGKLEIYDNGIIFDSGSGGASLHYYQFGKIADDGYSYKKLEEVEEEYIDENTEPIYRDVATEKKLQYKSFNEISEKYLKNANAIDFTKIEKK